MHAYRLTVPTLDTGYAVYVAPIVIAEAQQIYHTRLLFSRQWDKDKKTKSADDVDLHRSFHAKQAMVNKSNKRR